MKYVSRSRYRLEGGESTAVFYQAQAFPISEDNHSSTYGGNGMCEALSEMYKRLSSQNTLDDSFRAGVRACLPTILGYWSIGFAAGSIGALSGYSFQEIGLLAGLLYAGSAQFLFYGLAAAGGGPIAIALAVLLINIRYLLMGSALSPYFKGHSTAQKLIGGALLTDETFAVAIRHATQFNHLPFRWLLGLDVSAWLNWVVANLTGAEVAGRLPSSYADGLGFSLTAMFIGLVLLNYFASKRRRQELIAIGVASGTSLALFHHIGPNLMIIMATIVGATVALMMSFSKIRREDLWTKRS